MAVVNHQPVLYYQTDPRWKNIPYAAKGESSTIGGSGCGPTAMAMVLATWADPSVTPKTECAWAKAHGYKYLNQGTAYSYFVPAAKRYGLDCRQITPGYIYGNANSPYHEQARKALDNGDFVIACMGKGTWTRGGHYVLVWGVDGNTVYINDPASASAARTRGNYLVFKQQVKHYWIIKRPANKPLEGTITYREANHAVRVTDKGGLNCRKGPGLSYEVMKVFPFGTEMRISQTTSNGWGKTKGGWVNLTNTERVKDMTEAETRNLVSKMLSEQNAKLKADLISEIKKLLPKVYNDREEIPDWYKVAFEKVEPVVKGTGDGLGLSETELKIFTLLDRLGKLD